jgi:DNA-directed RNA polymerase specialized sigma subunit
VSEVRVSNSRVVSAVYELQRRHDEWPTKVEIAQYLETGGQDVLLALNTMQAQRILRKRQRKGRQVWIPWEQT